MHELCTLLGMPQHRFASIHVVGTNGKSSVTRMAAALLEAHGIGAGASVSPHASRWSERVLVHGEEIDRSRFASAVERTAEAAAVVNRSLDEGESVTQFELATAAAFVALAGARVEVAAIEAGLGGRLDATNTIPSRVTVLTSVGLDHTQWLGESVAEIAAEKLAVLREGSTLVLGQVSGAVAALARETAAERGCAVVEPGEPPLGAGLAAPYLRRNLGVALAAAAVVAGEVEADELRAALGSLELAGRFELVAGEPPMVLDAAHNPDGARALAEALAERVEARPVVACLAILADKDAPGIIDALAPALAAVVCTEIPESRLVGSGRPGTSAVPAAELVRLCEAASVPATAHTDPSGAVALARAMAGERGGVALIAGSHYLLPYGWTARPAQSSSR
jgi:dihydrofolate synthase / folylpolyglutamate synthase